MPQDQSTQFKDLFLSEIRRRLFDESWPRVERCLGELEEEEIWYRPNAHSNSVGNLILHLCGNARQWIVSGLGGAPDHRRRSEEFAEQGPISLPQLQHQLRILAGDIQDVLDRLTVEDLLREYTVQGFRETGISMLLHVVEHFSYHVGQITYFVKARKDIDLKYYTGHNLEQTNQG